MKMKTVFDRYGYALLAVLLCAALLAGSLSDYFVRCRRLRGEVLRDQ